MKQFTEVRGLVMPDGDLFRPIAVRFQTSYKALCEGRTDNKILADMILEPLKKNLQIYGNEPVSFIKQAGVYLSDLEAKAANGTSIDYGQAQKELETLRHRTPGNKKGINLALKAAKQQLEAIRHKEFSMNITLEIAKKYVDNIYKADFEKCVPLVPEHHNGVSPAVVDNRLASVRSDVEQGLHRYANQLVKKEDVNKIRFVRAAKPKEPINKDTSIFSFRKIGA